MMLDALTRLRQWLLNYFPDFTLLPIQGDASFRCYYRLNNNTPESYIVAISPPATENNLGFITVAKAFTQAGLSVPEVIQHDLKQGFLLMTDLGDKILYKYINNKNYYIFYDTALSELAKIQACQTLLPDLLLFDSGYMQQELLFFEQWFLQRHLKLTLSTHMQKTLYQAFKLLLDSAGTQPQVCIHRDYHAKNLMILNNHHIGILDFQDAMYGPVTYDLVSLIRDCYAVFPKDQVAQWAVDYYQAYLKKTIPSQALFWRYFDLMGIQRHLKAIFIFARKYHRDNVDAYLCYIPNALNYIIDVAEHYPELADFRELIQESKNLFEANSGR